MFRKGPCKLTLLLCALVHASKTWAGDSAALADSSLPGKDPAPALPASAFSAAADPFALHPSIDVFAPSAHLALPNPEPFQSEEFTPRKHTSGKSALADYGSSDPMFRSTTVWQRLNEFRAQDRVRVLTLWEIGSSNLSLQAGRKGDPSLQWSSSWTNRSKVSHGLLDRFVAASLSSMANKSRANSPHYSTSPAASTTPLITTAVPAGK